MASRIIVPLHHINWTAPWLAYWRDLGEPLAQQVLQGQAQPDALNTAALAPVRFVPQLELPEGRAYEQHIFATGCVPTREGLHDFFNGLVWMRFPLAKRALNRLQASQIAQDGVGARRGAVRDAITVLDENGALLQAPDALWKALVRKDWAAVFGELRPMWQQTRLVLFGHALMEQLVFPRKPITAHVVAVPEAIETIAHWDQWLSDRVSAPWLAAKPFAHLPVLGVPGWWRPNEDPAFYDDAQVFRPLRPIPQRAKAH